MLDGFPGSVEVSKVGGSAAFLPLACLLSAPMALASAVPGIILC